MLEVAKICLVATGDVKRAKRLLAKVLSSKKVAMGTQEEAVRLKEDFQLE
jgi:hypothetical protein